MTDHEATAADAVPTPYAVVEALLDGEATDPGALRLALEHREVRDHFVDLLLLRQGVREMDSGAWTGGARPRQRASRMAWLAAAAAVLMSLTAGYYTGQRTVSAAETQGVAAMVVAESTPAAPKPTQVIRLQPGVNWTDIPGATK